MRVAHVITRLIVGGAQENTIATVLGLRNRHHLHVDLVAGLSLGPEGSLETEVAAIPRLLTILPSLVRPLHPWKDWLARRQLTSLFRHWRPDIVHTHSGKAGILGRAAAHRAQVPIIVHTIHGPSFGPFQSALANQLFRSAERHAGRFTTHFVTVANAMTTQYLAAGIGTPSQYTRILSGFDLGPFVQASNSPTKRARFGIQPTDLVIGKIARLFKLKGHDDLFSAAPTLIQKYPNVKFLLVGDGEWRERFETIARDRGMAEHFIFTGLVPPSDVPSLLGIMDIVVHLSRREGLPRVVPQSLAAGKPVIAYDCDGAREVCFDGETGFLVEPGDIHSLTERLLDLAQSAELRNRLGQRGRALVQGCFPVEVMVDAIYALYQRLRQRPTELARP